MIRRNTLLMLLFTMLATGVAGNIHAQSKETAELSSKEQRQKNKEEKRKIKREYKEKLRRLGEPLAVAQPPVKKKYIVEYPQTTIKARYRIHVLMQMYLDDLVKGGNVTYKDRIPDKAQPGMAFYQGINIAADSLKKAGFKIDIYIHDIASAAETPDILVSKGLLDSADLIIGAVSASDIPVLADFAAARRINFVSATSATDAGVRSNPYFTMLLPSLKAHCEQIVAEVGEKYTGQNVLLFYRKSVEADSMAWKYVASADGINKVQIKKIPSKTLPSPEKLQEAIDTGKTNVVLLPVMDNGYADSILNVLATTYPQTHFEIYGMPNWVGIASKKKAFVNMNFHITAPYSFDMSSPSAKYIARTYKKDYSGKPAELVYRGYETMFWYANLLKQYGTVFNEHYSDNSAAPFNKFEVKPQWNKSGDILYNENMHVYLSSFSAAGASK